MDTEQAATFWFIFGKSLASEDAPDGFSSHKPEELSPDELRWWTHEHDGAILLASAIVGSLPDAMGTADGDMHIDYIVSNARGRIRPTLRVRVDRFERLPSEERLGIIASVICELGKREWVICDGPELSSASPAQSSALTGKGPKMDSDKPATFWFVFSPSLASEGAPDGFSSHKADELPPDELRWWMPERERLALVAPVIFEYLPKAMRMEDSDYNVDSIVVLFRGRARPTLQVIVDRFELLPSQDQLDWIAISMRDLGNYEWVAWEGPNLGTGPPVEPPASERPA